MKHPILMAVGKPFAINMPECKCGLAVCVCFVDGGAHSKNPRPVRPSKKPLFEPPPAPDGWVVQRTNPADPNLWVRVRTIYDEKLKKRVKLPDLYKTERAARRAAERIKARTWFKDTRVQPYWIKQPLFEPPPAPPRCGVS